LALNRVAEPSAKAEAKTEENPELGPALPDTLAVAVPGAENADVEALALPDNELNEDVLPGEKEILVPDGRPSLANDKLTKSLKTPIASAGVWKVNRLETTIHRDSARLSIAILSLVVLANIHSLSGSMQEPPPLLRTGRLVLKRKPRQWDSFHVPRWAISTLRSRG
jgi:hypothetical protein